IMVYGLTRTRFMDRRGAARLTPRPPRCARDLASLLFAPTLRNPDGSSSAMLSWWLTSLCEVSLSTSRAFPPRNTAFLCLRQVVNDGIRIDAYTLYGPERGGSSDTETATLRSRPR